MNTITPSQNTVNVDAALRMAAAQATCRYAGEAARIDRGLVLALNGHVTLHQDGTASVQSGTDAEIVYTVNGHCECPDYPRAPEGRCKHRWAKCLTKRAVSLLAAHTCTPQRATCAPQPTRYYASSYAPDGSCTQGTAHYVAGRGWLFVAEDGGDICYASGDALVLGGRVDILELQRAQDGDLVKKVCGY